jgi:magnesium transporter
MAETTESTEAGLSLGDGLLGRATRRATTLCPRAERKQTAGAVRDDLVGTDLESVGAVAVLEGEKLVGLIPILRLLAAPRDTRLELIMDPDPPAVRPGEDQEKVAWKMIRHGEASLPIVDDDGRFVGIIPAHDMLEALLTEHDEDMARIGGYLSSTSRARQAVEEPVARRLWHRFPWLLLGLLGAMLSAAIVGSFEDQISEKVVLAFFVPAVVYMADAVGTQTEALVIRGLSVGVAIGDVLKRELITGGVIGVAIGAAFLPFALIAFGEADVAVAVALALTASCSIATLVAMALPWAFQRLGKDPAFGSGPLATVIQDLLSIVVYFAVAIPIAT